MKKPGRAGFDVFYPSPLVLGVPSRLEGRSELLPNALKAFLRNRFLSPEERVGLLLMRIS
jgi:hypothetical protein